MTDNIKEISKELFEQDFFDESFDPDGQEIYLDKAQELMAQYPWLDIINTWHEFLFNNCNSPEDVINFANLFIYYGGADGYNPEPYTFLGYLFYRVDMNVYYDIAYNVFEAITLDILSYQNLIDLSEDPYYDPLKDPKIHNAIEIWKNQKNN